MAGKNKQTHVLCLRFSALGDVAIAAVVLKAYAQENKEVQFTFAGPPIPAPLFEGLANLAYLPLDRKQPVRLLLRQLKTVNPTHIADLHSVLRTFLLRTAFFFKGVPVTFLHKGRGARRRLLAGHRLPSRCLPASHLSVRSGAPATLKPMYLRYADVLEKLGFTAPSFDLTDIIPLPPAPWKKVGIAPFARHRGKQWSPERMREIARRLAEQGTFVYLFGGGTEEITQLKEWTKDHRHIQLGSGVEEPGCFRSQLAAMAALEVMISMDSANMHFASALRIPVLSVWGATHPKAGFYGYRQDPAGAIQLPLNCRPCSIYGAGTCRRGTHECLENLTVEHVMSYVRKK
ncbi:MAG: glycosyltransferase family 9 protein [Bacteroidales bacterium]|nr:glycosyltransferase family 9 protein [Bacteroidales bacterium]